MTDTDKDLLKQYDALQKEQEYLTRQLRRIRSDLAALKDTRVADTVTGSREDLTIGPIKVSGPPTMAYRATLRLLKSQEARYAESLARSKQLLAEIDATIGSVPDAKIRDILRRRYISGEKWETISKTYGKSREWARNTVENYFKK